MSDLLDQVNAIREKGDSKLTKKSNQTSNGTSTPQANGDVKEIPSNQTSSQKKSTPKSQDTKPKVRIYCITYFKM